jgi:CPA1 family monovalent cation:H+ antiporter
VEVLITLALVMGYALADRIHTSGPLAIVVAGLLLGNQGREFAMSETTRAHLDDFLELVDEILNALLFMLIGLEMLIMSFTAALFLAGLLAILVSLFSRWASVGGAVLLMRTFRSFSAGTINILTWGGLRGGISVAGPVSAGGAGENHDCDHDLYGRGLLHRHPGDDPGAAGWKNLSEGSESCCGA